MRKEKWALESDGALVIAGVVVHAPDKGEGLTKIRLAHAVACVNAAPRLLRAAKRMLKAMPGPGHVGSLRDGRPEPMGWNTCACEAHRAAKALCDAIADCAIEE